MQFPVNLASFSDKWEWASVLTLTLGGLVYIPLCILDIGKYKPVESVKVRTQAVRYGSPVWEFAGSGWA